MKKLFVFVIMVLSLVIALQPFSVHAAETIASGDCGTEGASVTWYLDSEGTLTITGTGAMVDYTVSSPAPWYSHCASINKVVISGEVTCIGSYAFSDCSSLTTVVFGDKLTRIGACAFLKCTSLSAMVVPEGVTEIGLGAFDKCSELEKIVLPSTLLRLERIFNGCSSLVDITLPDTPLHIDANVFDETAYYKGKANWVVGANQVLYIGNHLIKVKTDIFPSLTIREGVITVADSAMYWCTKLSEIVLPSTLQVIGDDAFNYCTGATINKIPDGVAYIGDRAFSEVTLGNVTLPACLSHIGEDAFTTAKVAAITVPSENKVYHSIDGHLIETASKTLIKAHIMSEKPEQGSILHIGPEAFYKGGHTFIELPEGLLSIGDYAFASNVSLKSIYIPRSVTKLSKSALSNCTALRYIYYGGTREEWAALTSEGLKIDCSTANVHYAIDPQMKAESDIPHLQQIPDGYIGIYTKEQLNAVRNNLSGNYILMADIIFSPEDFAEGGAYYNDGLGWKPIGNPQESFRGIFDGNGYGIQELEIYQFYATGYKEREDSYQYTYYLGLFGHNSGTIKNIGMLTGTIAYGGSDKMSGNLYAGSVVAYNTGTVENCCNLMPIDYVSMYSGTIYGGGIVGYSNSEQPIKNCRNYAGVFVGGTEGSFYAGGIAGRAKKVEDCLNTGSIRSSTSFPENTFAGGIVGSGQTEVTRCTNYGDIKAANAGGICIENSTVTDCSNRGNVSAYGARASVAGGIATGSSNITRCANFGLIKADSYYQTGDISGCAAYAGGILAKGSNNTIKDCYNIGNVTTQSDNVTEAGRIISYSGGILGYGYGKIDVLNCYNIGTIFGTYGGKSAGLIGYAVNGSVYATGSSCIQSVTVYRYDSSMSDNEKPKVLSAEAMCNVENFPSFDFNNVWTMEGSPDYPQPELRGISTEPWPIRLLSIQITSLPEKLTYSAGEPISLEGLTVLARYTDGAERETTAYTVYGSTEKGGKQTVVLDYLGKTTSFEITVKEHQHNWTAATCTDPKTCSVCKTTEGSAAGHKWTAATCTAPKTCSVCKTTEGSAAGHKWTAATCTDPKTCSVCKTTEGAALGHAWDNGVVTKEPTTTETGIKTFTCATCKITRTEEIAKLEASVQGVTRLAGADRYKTAFLAADMLKQQLGVKKFDVVVVASGTEFADALSGSYLAAVKNAPMLLVRNNKATLAQVKEYINKNLASGGTVYILGGENAVPKTMESGLEGFTVKRLGGATRYDTNLIILKEAGVGDKDILVCTGKGFADSLSASAAKLPILLVKDSLNSAQKDFLKGTAGKKYVIGGTSAVNAKIETALKAYGEVARLGGNTRYETSVLVAKTFFDKPTAVAIAYAQNFPDGLSGGALAAAMDAPLILTANGKEKAAADYAKSLGIQDGYILGGNTLISDKTAKNIFGVSTITVK